jgi:chromate transporter
VTETEPVPSVPFREASATFAKIGLESFGGPAAQIAVMHRVLVEEKKWVGEDRFLHALNFCMLLPGPEATQLVTYVGWLLHGTPGGLVAGALFILPGFVSLLALSCVYAAWGDVPEVRAVFSGVAAAVFAVVVQAVLRIGKRALRSAGHVVLAALSFVAIFFFNAPFPVLVLAAALLGFVFVRAAPPADAPPSRSGVPVGRTMRTALAWLAAWWLPVGLLVLVFGTASVFVAEALFFSKTACVTFGGAYAVLPYVQQRAVADFGWLSPEAMTHGLALAETTPGPLISVVQFVGFLGAFHQPGEMNPWTAGILGSMVTVWVTFVPCFLWIFLGAPYIEKLRGNRALSSALSAITAAVVGVILNLAVWFALHTLFGRVDTVWHGPLRVYSPEWGTVIWMHVAIAAASAVALLRFRVGQLWVIAGAAAAGLVAQLVG